jgi:hypothetical protein
MRRFMGCNHITITSHFTSLASIDRRFHRREPSYQRCVESHVPIGEPGKSRFSLMVSQTSNACRDTHVRPPKVETDYFTRTQPTNRGRTLVHHSEHTPTTRPHTCTRTHTHTNTHTHATTNSQAHTLTHAHACTYQTEQAEFNSAGRHTAAASTPTSFASLEA